MVDVRLGTAVGGGGGGGRLCAGGGSVGGGSIGAAPGIGGGLLFLLVAVVGVAAVGDAAGPSSNLELPGRGDVGMAGGGTETGGGGGARVAWLTSAFGVFTAGFSDISSSDSEPALGDTTVAAGTGGGGGRAETGSDATMSPEYTAPDLLSVGTGGGPGRPPGTGGAACSRVDATGMLVDCRTNSASTCPNSPRDRVLASSSPPSRSSSTGTLGGSGGRL